MLSQNCWLEGSATMWSLQVSSILCKYKSGDSLQVEHLTAKAHLQSYQHYFQTPNYNTAAVTEKGKNDNYL